MATKIRDIIDYYSGHNVPDEIKERVLDRISNTQDDKEANEAFRELWTRLIQPIWKKKKFLLHTTASSKQKKQEK